MEESQENKYFPKMFKVIIINGKGGCGKDTLISECEGYFKSVEFPSTGLPICVVNNISAITPVKEMLKKVGIDEAINGKDKKYRKLLSNIKDLLDDYGDITSSVVINTLVQLRDLYNESKISHARVVFVHMREENQISMVLRFLNILNFDCSSMIVRSSKTDAIKYGNSSDDNIGFFEYDKEFVNDAPIEEAGQEFTQIVHDLMFTKMPIDQIKKYYHNFNYQYSEPTEENPTQDHIRKMTAEEN